MALRYDDPVYYKANMYLLVRKAKQNGLKVEVDDGELRFEAQNGEIAIANFRKLLEQPGCGK